MTKVHAQTIHRYHAHAVIRITIRHITVYSCAIRTLHFKKQIQKHIKWQALQIRVAALCKTVAHSRTAVCAGYPRLFCDSSSLTTD